MILLKWWGQVSIIEDNSCNSCTKWDGHNIIVDARWMEVDRVLHPYAVR